jgi:hypothetical protein
MELGRVRINFNKMKIKNTTLSEQSQHQISKSRQKEAKCIPIADKYMTPHLPGVVQSLQLIMLDTDMVYYMYLLYKYI